MVFRLQFKNIFSKVRVSYMIVDGVYSPIFDLRADAIHVR